MCKNNRILPMAAAHTSSNGLYAIPLSWWEMYKMCTQHNFTQLNFCNWNWYVHSLKVDVFCKLSCIVMFTVLHWYTMVCYHKVEVYKWHF